MRASRLVAASFALLLAACASAPARFDAGVEAADAARTWPSNESRSAARYRLVGQLVGEANFVSEARLRDSAFGRTLRWIAGVDDRPDEPVVLRRPQGGAVDDTGRVLVADVSRRAIFVFDARGASLAIWDRAEARREFVAPIGVAAGRGGEVIVTDAELARVFVLDAAGEPLRAFGAGVLQRPTGVVRDARRARVYVADTHAHDVKVFDDDGRLVARVGSPGSGAGELNHPTYLAFANDRLYVTDSINARVQVFEADGGFVASIGRRGLYVGNLVMPKGVAVDADGTIYVVESFHDHLLMFDREGAFLMAIGGSGKGAGQFWLPTGVWTDAANRVYVADMFNGRVSVFESLGAAPR